MSRLSRLFRRRKLFGTEHFTRREIFRDDYRAIARHLLDRLEFDSAYDVGCANAFLLGAFQEAGKEVGGIELSPAVVDVLPESLRTAVAVGDFSNAAGLWDLVCCVEVAEHIPPERSRELVATVGGLARAWIYFSAAPPGQGGRGHINCRPHEEWLGWFEELGWRQDRERTAELRRTLGRLESVPWLGANSFLLAPVRAAGPAGPDRSGEDVGLSLVTRRDCHLCEEMERLLGAELAPRGLGYRTLDVDADPGLRERFGDVVPVLLRDGIPVAKVRLDRERLRRIIARRR